jgi:hypothetical protein
LYNKKIKKKIKEINKFGLCRLSLQQLRLMQYTVYTIQYICMYVCICAYYNVICIISSTHSALSIESARQITMSDPSRMMSLFFSLFHSLYFSLSLLFTQRSATFCSFSSTSLSMLYIYHNTFICCLHSLSLKSLLLKSINIVII